MKRSLLSTVLILTVVLTSCGTFEMSVEDPSHPTPTSASDLAVTGLPLLTMDSSSDEIRRALLDGPFRWQTIFMDAQVVPSSGSPYRIQVWVDQPNLSLRYLKGPLEGSAQTFRAVDGMSQLDLDIPTGQSSLSPFLDGNRTPPYTPQPFGTTPGVAQPHPLSTSVESPVGTMLFASDIAQNQGSFKPIGMEVIAYHLCLIVDWTYTQNVLPSYRAWVDVSNGVFLRYQQFEKGGGSDVLMDVKADRVDYGLSLPQELFSPIVSAMPDFSSDPTVGAAADTKIADAIANDPLGRIYSFVVDNSQAERIIHLVSLPASCVIGNVECPTPEQIQAPVSLTSSLMPLVWSPTRNEAAWAYPITADQRLWTLYIFNPKDNTWTDLASFDRYMDPPMWSRDGSWLAFRLQDGKGGSEIYAMRRDGSDMRILTDSKSLPSEGWPYVMDTWLGESVVLRSAKPGQVNAIYMMRVDDMTVKPLFDMPYSKAQFLESPDGAQLAYIDLQADGHTQIIKLITPDGKTLSEMATFTNGSVIGLTWSPDGLQLAFAVRTDTTSSVYTIDSDGRNLRQVYTSATDTQFIFSPDGNYLIVETIDGTGEHLYSIRLSTLVVHLIQAPGVGLNDSWMMPSWIK
jgi:hypothetical protein